MDFVLNGRYKFARCEGCDGPLLGHQEVKCKEGVRYDSEAVKSFEHWLKRISGFREAVIARNKKEKINVENLAEAMRVAIETKEKKDRPGGTAQLIKWRLPPLWSGQEFYRWRIEVEKWFNNNRSTEEENK